MNKFKFKKIYPTLGALFLCTNIWLFKSIHEPIIRVLLVILFCVGIYGIIDEFLVTYIIEIDGLTKKSLFKREKLLWNQIKYVRICPSLAKYRTFIQIKSSPYENGIIIDSWVKNYKQLLQQVLDKLDKDKVEIDEKVIGLLDKI
ncbi:hypothetical protein [Anaeromicrobium sediminis]|uniref:Uncharacterized protein n=1 Tax=Anaeromicrobium sediminis TaxID=1478221 RepID=A0A267MI31_9FIRM|nr:hypothetical protein [Anaeromicrobium sediminis]PAB59186.1 hypothetical protein CCE28_11750 [Anaeromicrobium sediminis]